MKQKKKTQEQQQAEHLQRLKKLHDESLKHYQK
jgi:hypothetical protein